MTRDRPQEKSLFKGIDRVISKKFYTKEHLTSHIEDNYTEFLDSYLQDYFRENSKILMMSSVDKKSEKVTDYYLNILKYSMEPTHYKGVDRVRKLITPALAMKYNLTRELSLNVQMYLSSNDRADPSTQEVLTRKRVKYELGRIPLLVNSKYDPYKEEGLLNPYHFLVNGSCRVLYHLLESNSTLKSVRVLLKNNDSLKLEKVSLRYSVDKDVNTKSFLLEYSDGVMVTLGNSHTKISIFTLLRLLKVSLPEIISLKSGKIDSLSLLNLAYEKYAKPFDQVVEEYLTSFRLPSTGEGGESGLEVALRHLEENLLPSRQIRYKDWTELKKEQLLNLLVEVLQAGHVSPEFQDSLANKRVFTVKNHFIKVFEKSFKQIIERGKVILLRDLGLIRKTKSLGHLIRSEIIKKSFRKYLTQGSTSISVPQSEHMSYTNLTTLVSAQRKVVSLLNKNITHEKYRSMNPSKPGRLCPVQTPHSRSVGLVEYLSLGTIYSRRVPTSQVLGVFDRVDSEKENSTGKLYINDKLIGYYYEDLKKIREKLSRMKRKSHLGVVVHDNDVHLRTSEGRLLKPFYVVLKEEPLICKLDTKTYEEMSLKDLISKGYVVYLDFTEQLNRLIAPTYSDLTKQTEVLHLNPGVYLSYLGSSLPLVSSNAAHRASLSLRLVDQAVGSKLNKTEFKYNELKVEYLVNSDPSILRTSFEDLTEESLGQNLILSFMHGEVEEDSLVMNRSAIQRGVLDSVMWKRTLKELKKEEGRFNYQVNDKIENPIQTLEEDHLPRVGTLINESPILVLDEMEDLSKAVTIKSPHTPYYINQISVDSPIEDTGVVEFRFSKLRKVEEGDKLGTRYGLKGVIGKLVSELDLLIPRDGVTPSLLISNHVISSRMVIGPLLEVFLTKAAVIKGEFLEIPVFGEDTDLVELVRDAQRVLSDSGSDPKGYQSVFDVSTLKEVKINMGPSKVFLLEHHSRDKFYVRTDKGGVSQLTHQPGEGRVVGGGLKFSEMESNAGLEHTATEFIKDRLSIDKIKVKICKCGYMWDLQKENLFCAICKKEAQTTTVELPYAFVVLTKILKAAHIGTKFHLQDEEDPIDDIDVSLDVPTESEEELLVADEES